jgi:hypothetical protein
MQQGGARGVEERVETVRDTVRHTEVEVDDDRTAARGAAEARTGATGAVGAPKAVTSPEPMGPGKSR